MNAEPTVFGGAQVAERDALERLQRRSSVHEPDVPGAAGSAWTALASGTRGVTFERSLRDHAGGKRPELVDQRRAAAPTAGRGDRERRPAVTGLEGREGRRERAGAARAHPSHERGAQRRAQRYPDALATT